MDDQNITLQEAIAEVDRLRKFEDIACRAHYHDSDGQVYGLHVGAWNAYKNVALLLSKIATKESE